MLKKMVLRLFLVMGLLASAVVVAEEAPESVNGAVTVDAAAAKELFDQGALFVDPRKQKDFDAGRIPDALHLDIKQGALTLEALESAAGKDDPVVFYCNGLKCPRSAAAAELAVKWGYSKAYYFRDGYPAWKSAGYPVE